MKRGLILLYAVGSYLFFILTAMYAIGFFGNVYVVVAKKRVAAVTPLKTSWKTRRRIIAGGVAKPTTRAPGKNCDQRNDLT